MKRIAIFRLKEIQLADVVWFFFFSYSMLRSGSMASDYFVFCALFDEKKAWVIMSNKCIFAIRAAGMRKRTHHIFSPKWMRQKNVEQALAVTKQYPLSHACVTKNFQRAQIAHTFWRLQQCHDMHQPFSIHSSKRNNQNKLRAIEIKNNAIFHLTARSSGTQAHGNELSAHSCDGHAHPRVMTFDGIIHGRCY